MKVIIRSKGCLAELQTPISNLDFDTIDRKFIKMESQLQREVQSVAKHQKKIFDDGHSQSVCGANVIRTVLASDRLTSLSSHEQDELFSTMALIALVDEGSVEYRSAIFNSEKFRGINRDILGQCLIQIALSGDLDFLNNLSFGFEAFGVTRDK